MELHDSRRLTGANFLWHLPGAVLDLLLEPGEVQADGERGSVADAVVAAWQLDARRMLDALGWQAHAVLAKHVSVARDGGIAPGLSLALAAPLDALYAACSVNEWALDAAVSRLGGAPIEGDDFEAARVRLTAEIVEEQNPALIALHAAAARNGVALLSDDDEVSVGMGTGSKVWPARELPAPEAVDWGAIHNVPTTIVTGTNGKSTTVRLLAAMATAAGHVPGISSTDWVRVGDEVLDEGDWSGPGGGRMLLRDPRVTLGLLETARGGMMRRGLALEDANLAVILNVGADHLSEWGTPDLESMAEAKFIPTRVAEGLVLNADDERIVATFARLWSDREAEVDVPEVSWFSLDPANPVVVEARAAGGCGALLLDDQLVRFEGDAILPLAPSSDVPMTLGGAARYNVANALAAVAAAHELGLADDAIAAGLRSFGSDPDDNPGRLNRFELGGVEVLVDFAHNAEGFAALFEAAAALPADRRLVLLGQSGDRDLESTKGMAEECVRAGFDHVVIKELTEHLRGRELGELPAEIEAALLEAGLAPGHFEHAPNELTAVEAAFRWARPGDLLLLLAHDARAEVLALIHRLQASGWQPGEPLGAPAEGAASVEET